jgi:hypothetical protein
MEPGILQLRLGIYHEERVFVEALNVESVDGLSVCDFSWL